MLEIVKCAVFWWQSDLINRLIHRSWGEGFANIFLDLSIHIFHFSSRLFSPALQRKIEGPILKVEGREPDTGETMGDKVRDGNQ